MKETLTLTGKLLLICAVIAALLAFVNSVTAPIIAKNNQISFETSMAEVLPGANGFEEADAADFAPSLGGVSVDSVYAAKDAGYVVTVVCSEGYGGDISVMTGVNRDFTVAQVKVMSMSETPGLGAKSTEPAFSDQYRGLHDGISVIKGSIGGENEIAAISGATITSKAVTKCVNTALEAAAFVGEKEGGEQ